MKLIFHPEAELEFSEAAIYYQDHITGLGSEFIDEVEHGLKLIRRHPDIFPLFEPDIRRVLIRRFPFAILYSKRHDSIYIIAIMHLHRHPFYWKHRV